MITSDTKAEFLEPSAYTYLLLMQHNIKTIGDLLKIRDEDLCLWRNVTKSRMDEIHAMQNKARSLLYVPAEKHRHFDHIKNMTEDEMADFLCKIDPSILSDRCKALEYLLSPDQ